MPREFLTGSYKYLLGPRQKGHPEVQLRTEKDFWFGAITGGQSFTTFQPLGSYTASPTVKCESVLPTSLQLSPLTLQLTAALGLCCPATHRSPPLPFSSHLSPCNSPQPLALAAQQLTAHLQLSSKAAAGSFQPTSHHGGDSKYPQGPIIPRGELLFPTGMGTKAIFNPPPKIPARIPVPAIDGDGDGKGSPPPWGSLLSNHLGYTQSR
ncbi:hypothetical protein SLEP1_g37244 [Rubroshorea leprosula]|uniref:Uncharacterized protein n=1 Tax=Rubroshorea leprosula TaxID=152421 RepID=A0AAV5KUA2_9ROSI|nr:hypothetical protein SLEP1_g37244 [Rubroshorea leprosula]